MNCLDGKVDGADCRRIIQFKHNQPDLQVRPTVVMSRQAILFYIPRWLWKNWEGGKIHSLLLDMDIGLVADVEKKQKKKMLLDYLHINLCHHNWWFYKYFFCELLALVNVIGTSKATTYTYTCIRCAYDSFPSTDH